MIRTIGCDVHKREIEVAALDESGGLLWRARSACTREALTRFATTQLLPTDRLVLEATTNAWAVAKLLRPFVAEVVVSNPLRTRAIAWAKIKTDKVDAVVLAQLLRCGFLPRVWQPHALTRRRRHLASRYASLVGDRTAVKNRIHSLLHERLITAPVPELFNRPGLAWLRQLPLDADGRAALDSELRILATLEQEVGHLEDTLAREAWGDEQVRLLMSLPGVDFPIALMVLAALGNIQRFPRPQCAAQYLGLAPSTRQTGKHCYHGPITKHGNPHARWLLVQAAQHVAAHPGPLGVFFRRLAQRKNRNVAVVGTARKLVVIAWHMLLHNEPYRYALPKTLQAKLARLRVRVSGQRRRGGVAKATPRSAQYGQGRTRSVPSLQQVCERESLPAPQPLAAGEQRLLAKLHLVRFNERLHKSRREPCGPLRNSKEGNNFQSTEKTS